MKRPRGDMSETTGRVVDIEFIQEPKTQALIGRVKTVRARKFFFKGGHVRKVEPGLNAWRLFP